MARHHGPVLVDTNVIIESWRVGAWKALTGGYAVETVATCFVETQTGFQHRRPEQQIDSKVLSATFKSVHPVEDLDFAKALTRDPEIGFLDAGEQALWAHAVSRTDAWVLCGPDKASLRIGIRLGLRDRLVSLERLLRDVGFRPKVDLKMAYTQKWLEQAVAELAQREGK
ncbi:hypothetical protein EN866_24220 [Mesorhizobium sp. M2D.F.Ca.ET.223.01.1.1]|uniref:hypothetical protein n=1 Tax=Mesorhizobium sp. M2D.F.Ca.ET.223.01.1.1 TaxID=2563940 RepID=UPI0010921C38|nr:hypothetical protein [Mesorhizobium sp. M2D.F.Ca.ET.223.01.1.1]TGP86406.1 hypothetical protein EN864_24230 [bacterium M00.F.Ca.ET.221.01.1.1]TGR88748.1 hypothetical protein EN866_24220 [Mesorhizobium sp. M2D.F.Ca.ET.223.01.1.1]